MGPQVVMARRDVDAALDAVRAFLQRNAVDLTDAAGLGHARQLLLGQLSGDPILTDGSRDPDELIVDLVAQARAGDPDAESVVCEDAKSARAAGRPLAAPLSGYLCDVALDGKPRRRRGRSPCAFESRNQLIMAAIRLVMRHGFRATRSARAALRESARSIVAKALGQVTLPAAVVHAVGNGVEGPEGTSEATFKA